MGIISKSNNSYTKCKHETFKIMEIILLSLESEHANSGKVDQKKKIDFKVFIPNLYIIRFFFFQDPIHRRTRELILLKEQLEKQIQDCRQEQQMRASKNMSTPSRLSTLH